MDSKVPYIVTATYFRGFQEVVEEVCSTDSPSRAVKVARDFIGEKHQHGVCFPERTGVKICLAEPEALELYSKTRIYSHELEWDTRAKVSGGLLPGWQEVWHEPFFRMRVMDDLIALRRDEKEIEEFLSPQ